MNGKCLTDFLKVQNKLELLKQTHLLKLFDSLLDDEQNQLIEALLSLENHSFQRQLSAFEKQSSSTHYTPFNQLIEPGDPDKVALGRKALEQGKCAALLIAGGQGTRLGHQGPKGTYPISPVYHKSLFQIFAEKVLRASEQYHQDLPLIVMTSPQNDHLTRRFFHQKEYFGLKPSQIHFFTQSTLPLLDLNHNLFLSDKNTLATGPDGNGSCYQCMREAGLVQKMQSIGVEYINFILIDNPLADPFDESLLGELIATESDVTLKTCQRLSSQEKVGVVVQNEDKPIVVEYHDLDPKFNFSTEPAANLSLMAMTLDFFTACSFYELPLHPVLKPAATYDPEQQKAIFPTAANSWKFEKYLFDILPLSKKTTVLNYPREKIFCPLKNKEGAFGAKSVKKSLSLAGIL